VLSCDDSFHACHRPRQTRFGRKVESSPAFFGAGISLFAPANSLFGTGKFPVSQEQGIAIQASNFASEFSKFFHPGDEQKNEIPC
jgi:hypothetical protein